MLRLVVDEEGQVWPDLLQKAPGRGAYLCMQRECLGQMNDKRLGALRRNFDVKLPQQKALMSRIGQGLHQQLMRLFSQHRAVVVLGRDAVMHQMWKSGPLLVLLGADAGEAVERQIRDAVEKREASKSKTELLNGFSTAFLAELFDRDKVSVAAVDSDAVSQKLQRFCLWCERMHGLKSFVKGS